MANNNNTPADSEPMPCRGCTEDCKNRPFCNGRPWRQKDESANTPSDSLWNKITKIFR